MTWQLPQEVALVYRVVGETHVFSSTGIDDVLIHIGSADRQKAFTDVFVALSMYASKKSGAPATYRPERSYEEFVEHIEDGSVMDNFMLARLESSNSLDHACH